MSQAEQYTEHCRSADEQQTTLSHLQFDRLTAVVQAMLRRRSIGRPLLLDDDLREAGLTSLDMVDLMLAVEAEFTLSIPDGEMTAQNFRSISAIGKLVASLTQMTAQLS